jgi:hypothetical protein
MPTVQEISEERANALEALDQQIASLIDEKNASTAASRKKALNNAIANLMNERTTLSATMVVAEDNSPDMVTALKALDAASTMLDATAANERKAADWLTKLAGFGDAASKLAGLLPIAKQS